MVQLQIQINDVSPINLRKLWKYANSQVENLCSIFPVEEIISSWTYWNRNVAVIKISVILLPKENKTWWGSHLLVIFSCGGGSSAGAPRCSCLRGGSLIPEPWMAASSTKHIPSLCWISCNNSTLQNFTEVRVASFAKHWKDTKMRNISRQTLLLHLMTTMTNPKHHVIISLSD